MAKKEKIAIDSAVFEFLAFIDKVREDVDIPIWKEEFLSGYTFPEQGNLPTKPVASLHNKKSSKHSLQT
jgi:hypothetical protein